MLKRNSTSKKLTSKGVVKASSVITTGKTVFRPDNRQTASLVQAGREGAAQAIRASRALGLPITYLQNGSLYKEFPDGTKEILKKAPVKSTSKKASQLKKGMILYAKG